MSRLSDHNVVLAKEIISRYPKQKSALIPLVHLSQEQNGYVTDDEGVGAVHPDDVTGGPAWIPATVPEESN